MGRSAPPGVADLVGEALGPNRIGARNDAAVPGGRRGRGRVRCRHPVGSGPPIPGRGTHERNGSESSTTATAGGLMKRDSQVKLGFYGTGEGGASLSRDWGSVTITRKK